MQPVRFKLNHNSTRLMPGEKDYSIWVGDLTPDVDDLALYKFFSARFQSVKSAKGEKEGAREGLAYCLYLLQLFLHNFFTRYY